MRNKKENKTEIIETKKVTPKRIAGKKKTFIVIGLGRFGSKVAEILEERNLDVLAIDVKEESVASVSTCVSHCVVADATKLNVLEELDAGSIDHAVVCIGNNLQASILTVLALKNLGCKRITVRADEPDHEEIYRRLGATEIINPEEASAISLANQIMSDSVLDYYSLSKDYAMVKIVAGDNFIPKTIIDMNVRALYEVNIVGIIKEGNEFTIPKPTDLVSPGDILVVVGTKEKYSKFDDYLNPKNKQ